MPARQPFTTLCQTLARPRTFGRADLHVHTTCSDGAYTPTQVVELGRRCGLCAIAITDHDTLAGIAEARIAAHEVMEVIAGVEISSEYQGRDVHLLGYFVRIDDKALLGALTRLQSQRQARFREMCTRMAGMGVELETRAVGDLQAGTSLGRRHLAELLVRSGKAANVREAFQRWLGARGRVHVPSARLPVADAIALVRQTGGVAAWAHPTYDGSKATLLKLCELGLQAVEVDYPSCRPGHARQLRVWARELGMAVTGGSDCHGPAAPLSGLGSCGVTAAELQILRELATT